MHPLSRSFGILFGLVCLLVLEGQTSLPAPTDPLPSLVSPAGTKPWMQCLTSRGITRLYRDPAREADKLSLFFPGTKARIQERKGDWIALDLGNNQAGWVESSLTAPTPCFDKPTTSEEGG